MMRYYAFGSIADIDSLHLKTKNNPVPLNDTDVIVRVEAASLNYKDLALARGDLPLNNGGGEHVPVSDGAGRVVAKGSAVTNVELGERVVAGFFPDFVDGNPNGSEKSLGHELQGMLSEFVRLPAHALVKIPPTLSFAEAAAFPCAGVTAWNALIEKGELGHEDTVLTMGTGGVSMFALQIAKAKGATVISLTGTEAKKAVLRQAGADHVVNYNRITDWDRAVLELTDGRGVDVIVEVGGAKTFQRSLNAATFGGRISAVGVLAGIAGAVDPTSIIFKSLTVNGVFVGNTRMLGDVVAFYNTNALHPVLDTETFRFEEAQAAFSRLMTQQHTGKIVIDVSQDTRNKDKDPTHRT
ncbi:NADPH:quinone oxidoreductase [Tateyamaria omphalii]|uniref:zinc-dependent alcohol dehydrogenase family protein n=1 Tax=Tateyamaria omphalii TaxID=299262 RepID=UPI00167B4F05|nr:NAD(P)-dependent alcohol dehydrogenase [Tateyamaria omphalii]GGX63609.1 NADPH:quinone oxidoreductase [Tateyamaria omphalii]